MSTSLLRRLSLALGFSLAASTALAETWPQPDWQSQPRVESAALAELEQYAFPERDDVERTGVRTDALRHLLECRPPCIPRGRLRSDPSLRHDHSLDEDRVDAHSRAGLCRLLRDVGRVVLKSMVDDSRGHRKRESGRATGKSEGVGSA